MVQKRYYYGNNRMIQADLEMININFNTEKTNLVSIKKYLKRIAEDCLMQNLKAVNAAYALIVDYFLLIFSNFKFK